MHVLASLVTAVSLAQGPQAPVLEFPEAGLDDPAAYDGYSTRFFRDSHRNSFQVYLDTRSGRVVHVWADATNASAAFTVRGLQDQIQRGEERDHAQAAPHKSGKKRHQDRRTISEAIARIRPVPSGSAASRLYKKGEPMRRSFDKAYYDRFYRDAKTRTTSRDEMAVLGKFVASFLEHMAQPVENVIDMGCGVGNWRPIIRRHFPAASYTGVEISRYTCREYGWKHGSVVDHDAGAAFDLVICHGVLQYLKAGDARRAVTNLNRLCSGALFLEVLTAEDWQHNCDRSVTDGDVYLRPASWYRSALSRYFTNCGGGVFTSPDSPAVPYELEKME